MLNESKLHYIMFDSGSYASKLMFSDLKHMNNVIETSSVFDIHSTFLRKLNRFHMSGKINRVIPLPFRQVWDKYYVTEIAKKHPENQYVFIFTNISIKKIRLQYLIKLRQLENVKLVLIAVDSFVDKFLCPLEIMEKISFDLVYSFDKKDCEEYGMIFTQSLYSKREDILPCPDETDVFFVGRDKGRLDVIKKIAREINDHGLKCQFYILGVGKERREIVPGIIYIDSIMNYDETLSKVLSAKCLLDIVQQGQDGFTMRVYESIFYNKQLITNNGSIREFKYYNPRSMFYSKDLDDLPYGFIKTNNVIDYNYKGEYSPISLLYDIERRIVESTV